jgi:hypothetical protein
MSAAGMLGTGMGTPHRRRWALGSHVKKATHERDHGVNRHLWFQHTNRDEEEIPMARQKIVVGMLLLGLALPLASCASTGKVRMSFSNMCRAHGGTYNAATQTCSYTQSVRTARQTCEQSHGYYDEAAQVCELGRE